jgi:hypothetical protein
MAGLWFEDLHKRVIWKGFGYGITKERHVTENWSATPSWSWLAASFPVIYPYVAGWWGGSVHRIYSPLDAEILVAHVSKSKPSRGFIQLWGSLAHVSFMAGKLIKLHKGRRPSVASTKKNTVANHLNLECDLDFRSKNWKSVYCVRIANFLLEYVTDRHPESGKFRGHYLVVERAGPLSLRRHPLDQGTFRRRNFQAYRCW